MSRRSVSINTNERLDVAPIVGAIADYVHGGEVVSPLEYETAWDGLMERLACGFEALKIPAVAALMGPVVPGAILNGGARVPGTSYELDPVHAAFNSGAMMGWLDSDASACTALGGILAVADYLSRGGTALRVRDMLTASIKTREIQTVLALESRCPVAETGVLTGLLGGDRRQIRHAVSEAWVDDGAPSCYRTLTGSRRAMAAGDAASRAVRQALRALKSPRDAPGSPGSPHSSAECQPFYVALPVGGCGLDGGSREEAVAARAEKFNASVAAHFGARRAAGIQRLFADRGALANMPVCEFMAGLVFPG